MNDREERHPLEQRAPKTLEEGLSLYELVCMPSRNFTAKTRFNYSNDLAHLLEFLEGNGKTRLAELSQRDLEAYLAEMDRRGLAGSSRQRKSYAIKSLFRLLYQSGYLDNDIASRLMPPRGEQKEPRVRLEVGHDALFVTKFGKVMEPRAIQYQVGKYLVLDAGIKGASVHTLRHTFGTHHVAQGTSLRTVQEVLGHADLKTTSIYVQLAQEVVRKELQEHAL